MGGAGSWAATHATRGPSPARASRRAGAETPGEKERGDAEMEMEPVSPEVFGGGADFRKLLKDIEQRYSDAFADLGPGALKHFKHLIDCIDGFLDLLADPGTNFRVKLMDYVKVERCIRVLQTLIMRSGLDRR